MADKITDTTAPKTTVNPYLQNVGTGTTSSRFSTVAQANQAYASKEIGVAEYNSAISSLGGTASVPSTSSSTTSSTATSTMPSTPATGSQIDVSPGSLASRNQSPFQPYETEAPDNKYIAPEGNDANWSLKGQMNVLAQSNPDMSAEEIVTKVKNEFGYRPVDDEVYNDFYNYYIPRQSSQSALDTGVPEGGIDPGATTGGDNDYMSQIDEEGEPIDEYVSESAGRIKDLEAIMKATYDIDMSDLAAATADMPEVTDYDQYRRDLMSEFGANTLKKEIEAKMNAMNDSLSGDANNPNLTEADRIGRAANTRNLYNEDINNKISLYNGVLGQIDSFISDKQQQFQEELTVSDTKYNRASQAFIDAQNLEQETYQRAETVRNDYLTALSSNVSSGTVMSEEDISSYAYNTGLNEITIRSLNNQAKLINESNELNMTQQRAAIAAIEAETADLINGANASSLSNYFSNASGATTASNVGNYVISHPSSEYAYDPISKTVVSDNITTDEEGRMWINGDRVECGEFFNDMFFPDGGGVRDDVGSKTLIANSVEPVIGGGYASSRGVWLDANGNRTDEANGVTFTGHVGAIMDIYEKDGEQWVTTLDANYYGKRTGELTENEQRVSDILGGPYGGGFYSPMERMVTMDEEKTMASQYTTSEFREYSSVPGVSDSIIKFLNTTPSKRGDIIDEFSGTPIAGMIQSIQSGDYSKLLTGEALTLSKALNSATIDLSGEKKTNLNSLMSTYASRLLEGDDTAITDLKGTIFTAVNSQNSDFQSSQDFMKKTKKLIDLYSLYYEDQGGGKTGPVVSSIESLNRWLGQTSDTRLAQLAQDTGIALTDYTKAKSGVQFSDKERAKYEKFFPSDWNTQELNATLLNNLHGIAATDISTDLSNATGMQINNFEDILTDDTVDLYYNIKPEGFVGSSESRRNKAYLDKQAEVNTYYQNFYENNKNRYSIDFSTNISQYTDPYASAMSTMSFGQSTPE